MNIVKVDMSGFNNLWSTLWQDSRYQLPMYSLLNIEYYKEYANESQFEDLSFVVVEGRPILGALLSVRIYPDGRHELSCFGNPILYLETKAKKIHQSQKDGAFKVAKREFEQIFHLHSPTSIIYRDYPPALSAFSKYLLLEKEARATLYFTQVIDLSRTEKYLHRQIRKSYKSLINWGKENLSLKLLDSQTIRQKDIEDFRKLHIEAAERETRSRKTWNLQYEMVLQGEAFVISGYIEHKLVTAAFFPYSAKYCYYGVSASDRELFDKPLSHVVVWTAILHAKKLGCQFFEVGEQHLPNQKNLSPSKKELGISTFKRGFGGQTCIGLNVIWTQSEKGRIYE